ncbi:hypothetical protein M9H77_36123 [Catharanthus roseus]|uniref:Uncharacterized protein n=1 Tax=Catharanthus roseus TaxID=4058 RepID=A0ACB9ZRA4_CATRO|nr:hypothetical protein M9H77_36123 [Catharanthus roseus]
MYISSQGIEKEESMKPSLLEKSSMVNELLQARIQIDESVKMHVEGEMSKEDFHNSMSEMSFEEEEIIEFERKDTVEEKERLVRNVKKMRALKKKRMILRKMKKKRDEIFESQEFYPTCLHHNINERKETYHGNFAKAFVKNQ